MDTFKATTGTIIKLKHYRSTSIKCLTTVRLFNGKANIFRKIKYNFDYCDFICLNIVVLSSTASETKCFIVFYL